MLDNFYKLIKNNPLQNNFYKCIEDNGYKLLLSEYSMHDYRIKNIIPVKDKKKNNFLVTEPFEDIQKISDGFDVTKIILINDLGTGAVFQLTEKRKESIFYV